MSEHEDFVPPSLEEASDGTTETSTEELWAIIGAPAMMAVIAGPEDGRSIRLLDLPLVVGRSPELADVAIADDAMSKQHFRVSRERGMLVVTDLRSSNGTLVNGASIQRAKVQHGDTVGAGETLIQFVSLRGATTETKEEKGVKPAEAKKIAKEREELDEREKEATEKRDELLKPENIDQLIAVLKNHVVDGRVYSETVVGLTEITTLGGGKLSVEVLRGGVKIDGAALQAVDIDASNGVIHVVGDVLVPTR